jgi:TatD DNase family protein
VPEAAAVHATRASALFDSHAHLADPRFAGDLPQVLSRAAEAGVREVLVPAAEPEDASRTAAIAAEAAAGPFAAPRVFWSAGLHPHEASRWSAAAEGAVISALGRGAVAVGETGLDFHYDHAPRDRQLEAFAAQAALARERDLPLIVHSREADDDTARVLVDGAMSAERVILHCFSAGDALFEEALRRGWYVSFSGLVTFRSFDRIHLLAEAADDRLLVETDAPYLAPVPFRGRRNEPAFLPATVARIAEARGTTAASVAALTRRNAFQVYKLPAAE